MRFIKRSSKNQSVLIAKERLKTLLVADRVQCKPDTYELLCNELYRAISKYIKVEEEYFNVNVTRSSIFITLVGEK